MASENAGTPTHGRIARPLWGILLIVAGVIGITTPIVAALATALVFGGILILGGGSEIAHAFESRSAPGFSWKLASGGMTLLLGIALAVLPVAGGLSLGLLIGAWLFAGGAVRTMLAFQLKPNRGWGWVLVDGILTILLAVVVSASFPQGPIAILAFIAGFWLILSGVMHIALRDVRDAQRL